MPRCLPIVLAVAASFGCSRDSGTAPEPRTPMPATLAGVYAGDLPCSNCEAIEATLWLRQDGRFFFRQTLTGGAPGIDSAERASEPTTMYGFGRWSWDEVSAEAVLRGAGPDRRLIVRDEQRLQLKVPSPVEHVLARDASAPPFSDRVMLDGESSVQENGATFVECLTGLKWSIADAGAYRELRRKHRSMNARGKVALTTIEGHLVTTKTESTTSERLVVDRFITMKPGQGC